MNAKDLEETEALVHTEVHNAVWKTIARWAGNSSIVNMVVVPVILKSGVHRQPIYLMWQQIRIIYGQG